MKAHPVLDPANFWLASVYLILLSVFGAILVEIFHEVTPNEKRLDYLLYGVAICLVFFVFAWIIYRREVRAWIESRPVITGIYSKPVEKAMALVALCGPSSETARAKNAAYEAAVYHLPDLKHLWLITSLSGKPTADWVREQLSARGVVVHEPVVIDNTWHVDAIKLKIEEARREAVEAFNVPEKEVICDFTGMQKPVTAGMILACAPKGRRMQYLHGKYDENGKLIPDAQSTPIEIEIEYQLERER